MRQLLCLKYDSCTEFRDGLLESKIYLGHFWGQLWGTELSPKVTEKTKPKYWPGQNTMGALLLELKQEALSHIVEEPIGAIAEEEESATPSPPQIAKPHHKRMTKKQMKKRNLL